MRNLTVTPKLGMNGLEAKLEAAYVLQAKGELTLEDLNRLRRSYEVERAMAEKIVINLWRNIPFDKNGIFLEEQDTIKIIDHDYVSLETGKSYQVHEPHGGSLTKYCDSEHQTDSCHFLLETPGVNLLGVHNYGLIFEITHRMGVPLAELDEEHIVKLDIELPERSLMHWHTQEKSK